eukprot:946143-Rhodomonas_salina.2
MAICCSVTLCVGFVSAGQQYLTVLLLLVCLCLSSCRSSCVAQRWVMDDIMAMTRILAVRDWLVLRHRHKRKAREAREKLQLAAERERDHEQQQLELTKLAAPMRLELTQDRDSASEQVQSGKGSMPATVASQTDTPRRAGGASRTGSAEEPEK